MGETSKVLKIRNRDHVSRRNFGGVTSRKRGESNFLRKFETAFFASEKKGIALDEFSVSQHGIADLLWLGWEMPDGKEFSALALKAQLKRRHLYAFEGKLTNWQKALSQAYRYRYYADKAIVVMPAENVGPAFKNLTAFEEAKVGLWSFDSLSGKIQKLYTPVKVRALSAKSRDKAIEKLASKLKLS